MSRRQDLLAQADAYDDMADLARQDGSTTVAQHFDTLARLLRHRATAMTVDAVTLLYLLAVWGDVEPEVMGPYHDDDARLDAARTIRKAEGESTGLYRLDVPESGKPIADAFSGGEMDLTP